MYSNTETKTCCKCNITKPKNNYYTNPARKIIVAYIVLNVLNY